MKGFLPAVSLLAVAFAFALGCAGLRTSPTPPAGPDWTGDHIRFPHEKHLHAQVECLACHEAIYDATSLQGEFLPPESKCLECHAEEKRRGNCRMCHEDVRRAGPYRHFDRHLAINHSKHIELVHEDCRRCHVDLPEPSTPWPHPSPPMRQCLSCHEHERQFAEAQCEVCHADLSRYPLRPVSTFSHQGDFVRTHSAVARSAGDRCVRCHDEGFCGDCHASTVATRIELQFPENVERHYIHRDDFLGRHEIEARANSTTCRRCHSVSFCEDCHQSSNLTPSATNPRNPHPPGWAFPGSATFHGLEARRDISRCAVCHDEGPASNCVSCHRVGGIGGNPHPPEWLSHHRHEEIPANPMCLYCHF